MFWPLLQTDVGGVVFTLFLAVLFPYAVRDRTPPAARKEARPATPGQLIQRIGELPAEWRAALFSRLTRSKHPLETVVLIVEYMSAAGKLGLDSYLEEVKVSTIQRTRIALSEIGDGRNAAFVSVIEQEVASRRRAFRRMQSLRWMWRNADDEESLWALRRYWRNNRKWEELLAAIESGFEGQRRPSPKGAREPLLKWIAPRFDSLQGEFDAVMEKLRLSATLGYRPSHRVFAAIFGAAWGFAATFGVRWYFS